MTNKIFPIFIRDLPCDNISPRFYKALEETSKPLEASENHQSYCHRKKIQKQILINITQQKFVAYFCCGRLIVCLIDMIPFYVLLCRYRQSYFYHLCGIGSYNFHFLGDSLLQQLALSN